jgi:hypothetical protein
VGDTTIVVSDVLQDPAENHFFRVAAERATVEGVASDPAGEFDFLSEFRVQGGVGRPIARGLDKASANAPDEARWCSDIPVLTFAVSETEDILTTEPQSSQRKASDTPIPQDHPPLSQ